MEDPPPTPQEEAKRELSNDELLLIFGFLAPLDVPPLGHVCRLWCTVANDDALWQQMCHKRRLAYESHPKRRRRVLLEFERMLAMVRGGKRSFGVFFEQGGQLLVPCDATEHSVQLQRAPARIHAAFAPKTAPILRACASFAGDIAAAAEADNASLDSLPPFTLKSQYDEDAEIDAMSMEQWAIADDPTFGLLVDREHHHVWFFDQASEDGASFIRKLEQLAVREQPLPRQIAHLDATLGGEWTPVGQLPNVPLPLHVVLVHHAEPVRSVQQSAIKRELRCCMRLAFSET